MRNELLGYLLKALDVEDQGRIEAELAKNHQLRGDIDVLRRSLEPLGWDNGHLDPPAGLARRTVEVVVFREALHPEVPMATAAAVSRLQPVWTEAPAPTRRWRMVDVTVAAGIFVAALSVVIPAIVQSRANAQRVACTNKLHDNYAALTTYADRHNGVLPVAKLSDGYEGKAGIYAPRLTEAGYLRDPSAVVCPGSPLADEDFEVPSIAKLKAARGAELQKLVSLMGGTYAFGLGYRQNGQYRPLIKLARDHYALMADLPGEKGSPIGHHGGCGRNVLFESGAIRYLTTCKMSGSRDDIYTNDDGEQDAGKGRDDSVLVGSDKSPSR
jgi:hypothetical protein